MKLSLHTERWAAKQPFRIAGHVYDAFDSLVAELSKDGAIGRGEALGVDYLGESVDGLLVQAGSLADQLCDGLNRVSLQGMLPAGGARNALDCALWDLEAKRSGRRIWELAGLEPRPLETFYTIGIEATPEEMASKAAAATNHRLLKIKLDSSGPLERMQAIRDARPDARMIVDANQGWTLKMLREIAPAMSQLGVEMIEQPLPRGEDAELEDFRSPVLLCADESCLHLGELEQASSRYQVINVKLDKTGGLTHALELARAARARGLGLMVGSMAGSSLAMAPAVALGWLCDMADVDGPLLQRWDRQPGLVYEKGVVAVFGPDIWG